MEQQYLKNIIRSAINGNEQAQKMIFQHYYGYVMSMTLRYLSTREEAEEVLNDIFFKVFKNLKKYNEQYPFKVWLRTISINSCIDKIRSSKYKMQTVQLENEDLIVDDVELKEDIDPIKILPILQSLSPKYRAVFNLFVFEDYKHKEIAKKLNISVGTSKSNFARAKAILKKTLSVNKQDQKTFIK